MRHPDYPNIEFKPDLAFWDADQTYDLVAILDTGARFSLAQGSYSPLNAFIDFLEGYYPAGDNFTAPISPLLIDRYFPQNLAVPSLYSKQLFDAVAPYSNSVLAIQRNLGGDFTAINLFAPSSRIISNYVSWSENNWLIPLSWRDSKAYLEIPLSAHNYPILISWFAKNGYHCPATGFVLPPHNLPYTAKIPLKLDSSEVSLGRANLPFLPCSFTLTRPDGDEVENNIVEAFDNFSRSLLYLNFPDLLTILTSAIEESNPNWNTLANIKGKYYTSVYYANNTNIGTLNLPYLITNTVSYLLGINPEDWTQYKNGDFGKYTSYRDLEYEIITFPDWMRKDLYRPANNNYWGIQGNHDLEDVGENYYYYFKESASLSDNRALPIYNEAEELSGYCCYSPFPVASDWYVNKFWYWWGAVNAGDRNITGGGQENSIPPSAYLNFDPYKPSNNNNYDRNRHYLTPYLFQFINPYQNECYASLSNVSYTATTINYDVVMDYYNYDVETESWEFIATEGDAGDSYISVVNGTSYIVSEVQFVGASRHIYRTIQQTPHSPNSVLYDQSIYYFTDIRGFIMTDSIRIKEIHACLGAGEYAYSASDTPAYMHMARRLEEVALAVGHSFNLDGSIMAIRQSKHLDRGATIPAGWSLGQFGRNNGANPDQNAQKGGLESEDRLGIVYEVKGNRFRKNEATGEEEVTEGGYVLCENLPQYLHVMLQDLDRSLGLQVLGSYAVANPNYNPSYKGSNKEITTPYYKYNGLGEAFLEVLYTLADTNRHAAQANIGSLKAQAISQEVLGALGVAVSEKLLKIEVDDREGKIKYPGFNGEGMTITDLLFWVLMNLATQNEV